MFFKLDDRRWGWLKKLLSRVQGVYSKRSLFWFLGIVLVVGGLIFAYFTRQHNLTWNPPDPMQVVRETVQNSLNAPTFRFVSDSKRQISGRDQVFHQLKGEKGGPGQYHVTGVLLGSPIEVYMVERELIVANPITGGWFRLKRAQTEELNRYLEELNPLALFLLPQISEISSLGVEEAAGQKTLAFEFKAGGEGQRIADQYWKDFRYKLWLDPKEKRLVQVRATAISRNNNQDTLEIQIQLQDFAETIPFTLPQSVSK